MSLRIGRDVALMLTMRGGLVSLIDRQARNTDVNIVGGVVSMIDRQARSTEVNIVGRGWGFCL